MERIRQPFRRRQAAPGQSTVDKLAHDRHAGAGSADRRRLRGHEMDRVF
jgi:hypothetical protein